MGNSGLLSQIGYKNPFGYSGHLPVEMKGLSYKDLENFRLQDYDPAKHGVSTERQVDAFEDLFKIRAKHQKGDPNVIPFQVDPAHSVDPLFALNTFPLNHYDDIAGHMGFLRRLDKGQYDFYN